MGLNGKFISSQRVSSVRCFIFLEMQLDSPPAVSKLSLVQSGLVLF